VRPGRATQLAVLEGRHLVEHYVSRPEDDDTSIDGNIYLGRVQNVLPGMEAAFVDIGTPKNGVIYVKNIAAALAKSDPANASDYRARAAAYTKELQTLDNWAKAEIASVPPTKRRVLASHDSLQYLAKAYGITLLSINGWTNNSEPSAAELARLTQQIKQEGIHALFLDSITDPRAMQRIAGETGAVIGGTLYGDSLSPAGGEADSYIKMLRHDVSTLKAGMLGN